MLFRSRLESGLYFILTVVVCSTASAETLMEEMVVIGSRGEKELGMVPAAVSSVGQDDIQLARQQLGLDESLNRVPGLFMQNRYNFAQDLRVSIRGAGTRASFGIRGIKIYIDDLPVTMTDGQGGVDDIDLGSAQRIEVMRGPASSLYGSSSGGVISIYTEDGPETPFAEAAATVGEFDMQKFQFKTGGQYGKFNYLVNASHLSMEGYRDHSLVDHALVNSKFRYDINTDSDLTFVFNAVDSPVADDPGSLPIALVAANPKQAWGNNLAFDAGESLSQQRMGLVYRHKFGEQHEITLRNFYLWRDFQTFLPFQGGGVSAFDRFFFGGGGQYTYTAALFGMPNRFTVGFDIDAQRDARQRYDNNFGNVGAQIQNQDEEAEAYGFYFRNELSLTDTIELAFGGRYDVVDMAIKDKFLANANQSASLDFSEFSPTVGLVWHVFPQTSVYANYGSAFETPTFTEAGGPIQDASGNGVTITGFRDVNAQTAESFEVGLRGNLWDRIDYDLAAYTMTVSDEIVNDGTLGNVGFFENADTDRNGVEASLVVDVFDGMKMTTAYTYSNFEFDQYPSNPALQGNKMPVIPEQQLFIELAYTHSSGLYVIWDILWVDELYANNANTVTNPAYKVANIRFGRDFQFGSLTLSPFFGINNMFNESYNGNVRPNSFGGRFFEPAPDQNAYGGLSARYNF